MKNYYHSFFNKNFIEKIYIHTDNQVYYTNENIWFKAYIFDSKKNQLNSIEQILVIELISPEKKIIFVKNYIIKKGVAWGNIFLPDSLNEGYYQIRAYTNSMKNFSSEFFFVKNIFINSNYNSYSLKLFKTTKKALRKKLKLFIDFKIESGKIISNLPCKIAFASKDYKDSLINADVFIEDSKGNIISKKTNTNCGFLTFIPKYNENYFLIARSKNYHNSKIKLTNIEKEGIVLNKYETKNYYYLKFYSNKTKTNDLLSKTYLLLGTNSGSISFMKIFHIDTINIIKIPKDSIPYGVTNFQLFDINNNLITSRPILKIDSNTNNIKIKSVLTKEFLILNFKSKHELKANISIAITSNNTTFYNVKQYFNYLSEIPYLSRNYNYLYFNKYNADLLLLLYYKNKYPFEKVENFKSLKHSPKSGISISGNIKFLKEQIPAKNGIISITILNSFNDIFKISSDEKGYFSFDNLIYRDTIHFTINAISKSNKKSVIIILNKYDTAQIYFDSYKQIKTENLKRKRIKKTTFQNDLNSISSYNLHPSQIITGKEITKTGNNNILNSLIGRIPGYKSLNQNARFHGNSFTENTEPIYLLNDIPVDATTISNVDPSDVERIEIINNPSDGILFGRQGINGIIAVFTKKSKNIKYGTIQGKTPGISYPEKFIMSKNYKPYFTYKWIANIELKNKNFILKIPLNIKSEAYINIQGINENNPFYYSEKINLSK